ncbi:FHA domain-containing protein [Serinicoccus kebangsaanensis]|uniref:FHA domain-containing protein n=1 Tax=Serinicoccus kebangsaanensis TaxID=2602069 RepID=UPI00124EC949|nr:FHA domain-containing protein [Serinicoccus kebangsaanensis]
MVRCPEGHESEATDYCDTCGSPIDAGSDLAAPASAGAGGAAAGDGAAGSVLDLGEPVGPPPQTCPHCGALNVADALFCESCGYDFTTGAAPMGDPAPDEPTPDEEAGQETEPEPATAPEPEAGDAPGPQPETGPEPAPETEGTPDTPPEPDTEVDPDPAAEPESPSEPEPQVEAETPPQPDVEPEPDPEPQPEVEPDAEPAQETEPEPEVDPDPEPDDAGAVAAHARPRHTPPSRDLADTWVVEAWVDPDWYAVQQTAEACPSAGVPDVVVVRRSVVLIGRPSGSLGVRPEVDAGADSAVSRRHAQLTSDGRRWWIEDLDSSNGTYVGTVGEPLPTTPLTPGQRVEIDRDDRIYVGAWTRLVLRQATESEREGLG